MTKRLLLSLFLASASVLFAAKAEPKPAPTVPADGKIAVTVGELLAVNDSGALIKIASQDLPAATAFRIRRVIDTLAPIVSNAVQQRAKLFTADNSEAVPGQEGQSRIKAGAIEAYVKALTPLLGEKVELTITPITEKDLEQVKLSANDIAALGPLLKKSPAQPAREDTEGK